MSEGAPSGDLDADCWPCSRVAQLRGLLNVSGFVAVRSGFVGWRGSLLLIVFGLCLMGGSAARAARPLSWSAPLLVDHRAPYATLISMSAVSCRSRSLCVAVGNSGDVATSTNPAGGSGAWRFAHVDGSQPLEAVACPSVSLCVAADGAGRLLISEHPTRGTAFWKAFAVRGLQAGRARRYQAYVWDLSCPSRSLCVGVDNGGDVVTSTDPAGGASAWRVVHIESPFLVGVSCASASLCAAVDGSGDVVTSSRPSRGVAAWRVSRVPGVQGMSGIACPSVSLCVAAGFPGDIVTSSRPLGGGSAWSVSQVERTPQPGLPPLTGFTRVSCASISLCTVTDGPNVVTSSNPAGGVSAWTVNHVAPAAPSGFNAVSGLSCAGGRSCVAFDRAGHVMTTSDATGGAAAWRIRKLGVGYNMVSQVTCPSRSLCVAVDNAGNVVTSTDPGVASTWKVAHVGEVGSLACASTSLCAMFNGATGDVIVSTGPAGGATAWRIFHIDTATNGVSGIACGSTSLCVAFDGAGDVLTSTDPEGGASAWHFSHVDHASISCGSHEMDTCQGTITALECPSANECVATDSIGYVLASANPAAGEWNQAPIDVTVDQYNPIDLLACPSASFCAAADFTGGVLTSTHPTGGAAAWKLTPVQTNAYGFLLDIACPSRKLCVGITSDSVYASHDPLNQAWATFTVDPLPDPLTPGLVQIACPSSARCVAVDSRGNVVTSTNPTAGATWRRRHIDTYGLSSVACPTASLCLATDDHGYITVGRAA